MYRPDPSRHGSVSCILVSLRLESEVERVGNRAPEQTACKVAVPHFCQSVRPIAGKACKLNK